MQEESGRRRGETEERRWGGREWEGLILPNGVVQHLVLSLVGAVMMEDHATDLVVRKWAWQVCASDR